MKYCLFGVFLLILFTSYGVSGKKDSESAKSSETVTESSSNATETLSLNKTEVADGKYRNSKILPGDETCRAMEIEADKSFKKILMIGEDLIIPRNETEIVTYCKKGKAALKLATRYGKCLQTFPRQVLSILVRGGKKSLREYCDISKGRAEILKHLECINEQNAQIFYGALEHGFKRVDYIAENIADQDLLSTLCCAFHLIYNQTITLVKQHCAKSPDSTVRFLRTIVDNIAKDVLDLGCGKWPSVKSCDTQIPEIMKSLRAVEPNTNKTNLQKRFLIGPVVHIAARLVS